MIKIGIKITSYYLGYIDRYLVNGGPHTTKQANRRIIPIPIKNPYIKHELNVRVLKTQTVS